MSVFEEGAQVTLPTLRGRASFVTIRRDEESEQGMWEGTEDIEIAATTDRVWSIVADIEGHTSLAGSGEVRAIRLHGAPAASVTFEGDIATSEVGTFVSRNRIEVFDPPGELSWKSWPPLDVRSINRANRPRGDRPRRHATNAREPEETRRSVIPRTCEVTPCQTSL